MTRGLSKYPSVRVRQSHHITPPPFFLTFRSTIPLHLIALARILIFMIAILAHGRQVEWTARLDFLWQLQASQEKREMSVLQQSNKRILYNLLPAHVAAHFLDDQFRNNMVSGVYSNSHSTTCPHNKLSIFFFVFFSIGGWCCV